MKGIDPSSQLKSKYRIPSNDAARADFSQIERAKCDLHLVAQTRHADLRDEREALAEAKALSDRATTLTLAEVMAVAYLKSLQLPG